MTPDTPLKLANHFSNLLNLTSMIDRLSRYSVNNMSYMTPDTPLKLTNHFSDFLSLKTYATMKFGISGILHVPTFGYSKL
jgi:hypothetical protein